MTEGELQSRASALAGEPLSRPEPVRGGGNNRLYRVRGRSRDYALKRYPDDPADARSRFEPEFAALRFLWEIGERRIPEPVGLDANAGIALYAWVPGERIVAPSDANVEALAAFAGSLHAARLLPGAAALGLAREAVLAPAELARQLRVRLQRLSAVAPTERGLDGVLRDIQRELDRRGEPPDAGAILPGRLQTLSPSDFGLHNALAGPQQITFLDFEYFGWDDPVKLTADVVWHPGMNLDARRGQNFYDTVADWYGVDPNFRARFERDAPLYGLRWALIVLGEFLPDVWARRVAAGAADRPGTLARQLAKADALVTRSRHNAVFG